MKHTNKKNRKTATIHQGEETTVVSMGPTQDEAPETQPEPIAPFQVGDVIEIESGKNRGIQVVTAILRPKQGEEFRVKTQVYKKDGTLGTWTHEVTNLDNLFASQVPQPKVKEPITDQPIEELAAEVQSSAEAE